MIVEGTSNLIHQPVEALVNTVNCVGVMGKGIALQFKQYFPNNYHAYAKACIAGAVQPGKMFLYKPTTGPLIINFPTKLHWRNPSRMSYIDDGLIDLIEHIKALGVKSIAIPPLGCGNGGLNWAIVKPKIIESFACIPHVHVALYDPR